MRHFALTRFPTPVLTTPAFDLCFGGEKKDSLPLDEQDLLRPIEMVLFPHSKIELLEKIAGGPIWKIRTQEQLFADPLYIDERFIAKVDSSAPERKYVLPTIREISSHLCELLGARYIWGGNWPQGIPQLFTWYAPLIEKKNLSALMHDTWQLKGVDCSGLLYFVTNGYTPRNTVQLIDFGQKVPIEGKSISEILTSLLPLDIIVWKGHVVIVLNTKSAIESRGGQGVVLSPLEKRLQEIVKERKPVDVYTSEMPSLVIRRWHPTYVDLR